MINIGSKQLSLPKSIGFVAGPVFAFTIASNAAPSGLSIQGWWTTAIACWMAIWWITEAVPLAATALIPVVAFPITEIKSLAEIVESYTHPLIFLFLGGFLLARTVNIWGLDRRLAESAIALSGTSPPRLVAAIMLVTAFLSMWVSNTATAMVMLPIGLSLISLFNQHDLEVSENFEPALLLGIAYAATIGGIGTIIGTPPNALFVAFMESSYDIQISFLRWMAVGLPLVVILLPLSWLLLTKYAFKLDSRIPLQLDKAIRQHISSHQPLTRPQVMVSMLLCTVAGAWVLRPLIVQLAPWLPVTDAGIAMTGAIIAFVIPANIKRGQFLLDWKQASNIRWDVLILFGGGLALASAISGTDLASWIGHWLNSLEFLNYALFLLLLGVIIVVVGELASNTAMAAVFLPIAGAAAASMNLSPLALTLPVTLFATLGFMLPVATPPNAIVFSSGALRVQQMMKAGIVLDILGVVIVSVGILSFDLWTFLIG